jgi:uncharacterized protein (PEP-CTERM system associated)
MRFGAQEARSSIRRYLPAGMAVGAAMCVVAASPALAELILRPSLTLEQIFTDNVRADGADRDADGVTVASANLLAQLITPNIIGLADVNVFYNEFWATNDLDSGNAVGTVAARAEVLNNFFFIDAIATKQDVYLQPTDQSASGLTTGQGSLQQMNWAVSPFITSDLFGLADLEVRGNYAQVQFDEPVVGVAATLISDITVKQAGARITTGERSSLYELIGTAEYLETDQGFEQRNVIGGAILNVTKNLSLIGRYGYERISDPSLTTIRGPIWSAGGRFRLGPQSAIQLEYGRRFDDDTFLAQVDFALTPRLQVTGNYTDTLIPIQLTLVRGVVDLLDQDGNFIISAPNAPSIPDPTLVDAIVRDKEMRLQGTYTRDLQTVTMTLGHTERQFPTLNDDESFFFAGVVLQEKLSRRLDYVLNLRFQDNYATLVTNTTSQIYTTELAVVYQYTQDIAFGGGYAWRLETTPGDNDVYENVLRFSVTQSY